MEIVSITTNPTKRDAKFLHCHCDSSFLVKAAINISSDDVVELVLCSAVVTTARAYKQIDKLSILVRLRAELT